MKRIVLLAAILTISFGVFSQTNPITWSISQSRVADGSYDVIISADIHHDWYIYGMNIGEGGPLPLVISLEDQENVVHSAHFSEITPAVTMYDEVFGMDVSTYKSHAEFKCNYNPKTAISSITLIIDGQACNKINGSCVQVFENIPFTISQ